MGILEQSTQKVWDVGINVGVMQSWKEVMAQRGEGKVTGDDIKTLHCIMLCRVFNAKSRGCHLHRQQCSFCSGVGQCGDCARMLDGNFT